MTSDLRVPRRSILIGLIAGASGLLLSGCASGAEFDAVNSLAARLRLGSVGDEIIRDYHGRERPVEGDHPTLMLLMGGSASEIEAPTVEALKQNRFEKDKETDYWTKRLPRETSILAFHAFRPGESIYFPQHEKRLTIESESVLFTLTVVS